MAEEALTWRELADIVADLCFRREVELGRGRGYCASSTWAWILPFGCYTKVFEIWKTSLI